MTEVQYFGYGANRNPSMIKAILGRIPRGFPAKIEGYELCIQSWGDIPYRVRKELAPAWGEGFKTYCVRPAEDKFVRGRVWILTEEERKIIDDWELTEFWYHPMVVHYFKPSGETIQVEVQIIKNQDITWIVDGEKYPTFINGRQKMFRVAEKVRELSLEGKGGKKRLEELSRRRSLPN